MLGVKVMVERVEGCGPSLELDVEEGADRYTRRSITIHEAFEAIMAWNTLWKGLPCARENTPIKDLEKWARLHVESLVDALAEVIAYHIKPAGVSLSNAKFKYSGTVAGVEIQINFGKRLHQSFRELGVTCGVTEYYGEMLASPVLRKLGILTTETYH